MVFGVSALCLAVESHFHHKVKLPSKRFIKPEPPDPPKWMMREDRTVTVEMRCKRCGCQYVGYTLRAVGIQQIMNDNGVPEHLLDLPHEFVAHRLIKDDNITYGNSCLASRISVHECGSNCVGIGEVVEVKLN